MSTKSSEKDKSPKNVVRHILTFIWAIHPLGREFMKSSMSLRKYLRFHTKVYVDLKWHTDLKEEAIGTGVNFINNDRCGGSYANERRCCCHSFAKQ